jgi:hypothetical protein
MTNGSLSITERVARYLAAIPPAKTGNHGDNQTFSVASQLVHGWSLPKLCALTWLRIYNQKCQPRWSCRELLRKINNAAKANHARPRGHLFGQNLPESNGDIIDSVNDFTKFSSARRAEVLSSTAAPKPEFDPQAFAKFVAGHDPVDAAWLAMRSPICPWNRTPASALNPLYRKGENVVVFDDYHSQGRALWTHPGVPYDARTLNAFTKGKRLGVWFLANPVNGESRINDEGRLSRRSWQNVTSWRYLVVESDRQDISPTDWLTALAQLRLPIAAICESGGRLAHALLRIDASSKQQWDQIRDDLLPLLVMVGADPSSVSAVRLTRLPCCQRLGKQDRNGKYQRFEDGPHLQRLLYLNASPDGTPITQQKVWPDPLKQDCQPSDDSES